MNYAWSPAGNSVALDQDVPVYGGGTANPSGTWVKDLVSGRETLISFPSGVMGPFVKATWLDEKRLLTSQGTAAPEARAIVADITSGETILKLPRGFYPLGLREDGFVGVFRERENWGEAALAIWKPGKDMQFLISKKATNFSMDPSGQRVAWLNDTNSKRIDGSPYNVHQVEIYHLDSGQVKTYPVWGHETSWSPDGSYLVIPAGNKLHILEVNTGGIQHLDGYNDYPS